MQRTEAVSGLDSGHPDGTRKDSTPPSGALVRCFRADCESGED